MRSKDPAIMQKIIEYVEDYQRENNGNSPSKAMIGEAVGMTRASASNYLIAMAERGLISYDGYHIGTSYMNKFNTEGSSVIILNNSGSCGKPDIQEQDIKGKCMLPVEIFGRGNFYIITASGDSMEDAHIFTGDLLVVETSSKPVKGDIVVAMIDNETTVKRYDGVKNGKAVLAYMNEKVYPGKTIALEEFICLGIVKSVIRTMG